MITPKDNSPQINSDSEFVISRVFNAPRELVWKAYTEIDRVKEWWGPKGFTMGVGKLDLRPGGIFHYSITAPNGLTMWGKMTYRELSAPERMVTVLHFSDEKGGVTRHPMSQNWPLQTFNIMTLTEENGKTTLTLRSVPHEATEVERKTFVDGRNSMTQGFTGTFDQLEAYLTKAQQKA